MGGRPVDARVGCSKRGWGRSEGKGINKQQLRIKGIVGHEHAAPEKGKKNKEKKIRHLREKEEYRERSPSKGEGEKNPASARSPHYLARQEGEKGRVQEALFRGQKGGRGELSREAVLLHIFRPPSTPSRSRRERPKTSIHEDRTRPFIIETEPPLPSSR